MVGRPDKRSVEDLILLLIIGAVIVYAVWKIMAG
jgi:hypothetical protein